MLAGVARTLSVIWLGILASSFCFPVNLPGIAARSAATALRAPEIAKTQTNKMHTTTNRFIQNLPFDLKSSTIV